MSVSPTSSSALSSNYMTLLVKQLQSQDPLDPMDNNQMTAQLTAMSQLEKLESIDSSFAKVLEMQQKAQGANLVGKTVQFTADDEGNTDTGKVQAVDISGDTIRVLVGQSVIPMDRIMKISE